MRGAGERCERFSGDHQQLVPPGFRSKHGNLQVIRVKKETGCCTIPASIPDESGVAQIRNTPVRTGHAHPLLLAGSPSTRDIPMQHDGGDHLSVARKYATGYRRKMDARAAAIDSNVESLFHIDG